VITIAEGDGDPAETPVVEIVPVSIEHGPATARRPRAGAAVRARMPLLSVEELLFNKRRGVVETGGGD
jgi:hypothetical protein